MYSNEVSTSAVGRPLTATGLTSNASAQPRAGNTITFTAAATGGVPQYQYKWLVSDGSSSRIGQNWSPNHTFAWTPTQPKPGYQVTVWVRSASSTADTLENPAATLSMTIAVNPNAASSVPAGRGGRRPGVARQGALPPQTPAPTSQGSSPPTPAPTSPGSSSPAIAAAANSGSTTTGVANPNQERKQANATTTSASAAASPAGSTSRGVIPKPVTSVGTNAATPTSPPAPATIVIAGLPPSAGAPAPRESSSEGVVSRPHTQNRGRTDAASFEPPQPYEFPTPPSAPAGTVTTNRTVPESAVAPSSESGTRSVVTKPHNQSLNRTGVAKADPDTHEVPPAPGPAPSVASIVPSSGSVKGGTTVTITGANFAPGATVSFGGVPAATTVLVASGTSIVATTPSHAGGAVKVVVTNPDHQSGTRADGFKYIAPAGSLPLRPAD